jgi:hypothetical protein
LHVTEPRIGTLRVTMWSSYHVGSTVRYAGSAACGYAENSPKISFITTGGFTPDAIRM